MRLAILGLVFTSIFGSFDTHRIVAQPIKDSSTVASIALASAVPAALITSIFYLNEQAFWKYATDVPFHLSNDPPYSMHIDKFAHMALSDVSAEGISEAYKLAGVNVEKAVWLGGGLTFAAGLVMEM